MFCMFLFFGVITSYAGFSMLSDILFFNDKINDLTRKINDETNIKNELTAVLAGYSRQETVYATSLSIMQEDLPTIEVFDALDRSVIRGVILDSLTLNHTEMKIEGVANAEDDVVTTARNLLDSGTFSVAQVPVVSRLNTGSRANASGRDGFKFALSLVPLSIGESGRK